MSDKDTEIVRVQMTKETRSKLKLIAALRGQTMQEAAQDVFEAEVEKLMKGERVGNE
jgi:hypothetical protein